MLVCGIMRLLPKWLPRFSHGEFKTHSSLRRPSRDPRLCRWKRGNVDQQPRKAPQM